MTRAMYLLYLTYARSRVVGEETKEHLPSRFLASIPKHLIERRSASTDAERVLGSLPFELPQVNRCIVVSLDR
jgi:hypothetical protein